METMLKEELIGKAFEELEKFLKERVTQSPIHRMAYSRDWSPRESDAANLPDIVVIPKTTEEMVRIAQVALQYGIPVVPLGGGTGMGRDSGLEGRHHRRQRDESGIGNR
jgi:FAD/FMN-containing dehydrogenase